MGSSADSPVISMPARARSRVSNGKALFADATVDGRSSWPRRLRDLLSLHISDLGGEEVVSAAERSIIRRIATITVEQELTGEEVCARRRCRRRRPRLVSSCFKHSKTFTRSSRPEARRTT